MSIFEFDGPPSWSLDASETGENTKCPWVEAVGLIAWGEAISFPEAAILLVSDGDRDLCPGSTLEVPDSRTSRHSAHAQSQV